MVFNVKCQLGSLKFKKHAEGHPFGNTQAVKSKAVSSIFVVMLSIVWQVGGSHRLID